jgi:hypothetical protein
MREEVLQGDWLPTLTPRFSPPFCHQSLTHKSLASPYGMYPAQQILAGIGLHDVPVRSRLHSFPGDLD